MVCTHVRCRRGGERRRLRGGGSRSHSELHHTAGTEPPACLWYHRAPVSHPATHWRGTAPPWVGSQPAPGHCPPTRTVWLHLKCGQPGHRGGGIEWGRGQLLVPEALLFWLFLLTPPQGPGPWRQILGVLCVKCQVGRSSLAVQGLGLGVFIAVSGVQSRVGETKSPKAKLCLGQINEYIRLGEKKVKCKNLLSTTFSLGLGMASHQITQMPISPGCRRLALVSLLFF